MALIGPVSELVVLNNNTVLFGLCRMQQSCGDQAWWRLGCRYTPGSGTPAVCPGGAQLAVGAAAAAAAAAQAEVGYSLLINANNFMTM